VGSLFPVAAVAMGCCYLAGSPKVRYDRTGHLSVLHKRESCPAEG